MITRSLEVKPRVKPAVMGGVREQVTNTVRDQLIPEVKLGVRTVVMPGVSSGEGFHMR